MMLGRRSIIRVTRRQKHSFLEYVIELKQRGLLKSSYPSDLSEKFRHELEKLPPYAYAGFDPTAESLHVGNLLVLTNLLRLQKHGITPIAIIGGATARIGDPSGRTSERDLISEILVERDAFKITKQISRILVRPSCSQNQTIILNNLKWFEAIDMVTNLRNCKRMQVGEMLRMGAIKSRMDKKTDRLSYQEFSYQTMQAYDWKVLSDTYGCQFQLGGSDQLGHLDFGAHYIKRTSKTFAAGVCLPLLTDSHGNKLGKSVGGGSVWLDAEKTSPSSFHEYFVSIANDKAEELLMQLSLRPLDELKEVIQEHRAEKEKKLAQIALADEMCDLVHSPNFEDTKYEDVHDTPIISSSSIPSDPVTENSHNFTTLKQIIDDLENRKLLNDWKIHDVCSRNLSPNAYAVFDPISDSLTLADLALLINLLRLQQFKVKTFILVGEANALIGDPSGKEKETPLLPTSVVEENSVKVTKQLKKIFSRLSDAPEIINNSQWFGKMSAIEHYRLGKNMLIEDMLDGKSILSRMEKNGLSHTEFSYQTLQAYDWLMLSAKHGCDLQLAKLHKAANLKFGSSYVKKVSNRNVIGVPVPSVFDSLLKTTGKKIEDNVVWLDAQKTSPFHFYQHLAQLHDDKAELALLQLSLRPMEQVQILLEEHRNNLGKWIAQKEIAKEMTELVHGEKGLMMALRCTSALFGGGTVKLSDLNRDEIVQLFGTYVEIRTDEIEVFGDIADRTCTNKVSGRILMKEGAFSVNGVKKKIADERIKDVALENAPDLSLVCWGKRKYQLVKWV